ncbi:MAG: S-layer homology domain-containing protein [Chloroflexota bacterium]|nr:S-layer homology domain-containing protein [Chloroflexota bacterium]
MATITTVATIAKRQRSVRVWALLATLAVFLIASLVLLTGSTSAAPRRAIVTDGKTTAPATCMQFGTVFSPNPDPAPNGPANILYSVSARSSNDVWAVGNYANNSSLIEHWDGSAWSVVSSPNPGTSLNILRSVSARASNDVWAVGSYYNGTIYQTLVEHWDGSAWSVIPSQNVSTGVNNLRGVWAVASNDVWAVGYYANPARPGQTLVEHWDGSAWSVASNPNPGTTANVLVGVSALTNNDVWVVGASFNGSNPGQTLVEHWDGNAWSVVPSPNVGSSGSELVAVSAVAGNDVWAVGDHGSGNASQTLVEHWNGSIWSVVPGPSPGTSTVLNGVSAVAGNDVWASGGYFDGNATQTLAEHWDGTSWSVVPSQNPGAASNTFAGVSALVNNAVWAAGSYGGSTLVEEYGVGCGTSTPQPTGTTPQPTATQGGGGATATSTVVPSPTATTIPGDYNDVPPGSPFYAYVSCLSHRSIVSGYICGGDGEPCPGTYFRPGNNVTRGQAAKIISNAAGYTDNIPSVRQTFADVPSSSPFWLYVERVAAHGAISGYACGGAGEPCPGTYFRPGNNLTRGQLAKIDSNAAAYNDNIPAAQQTFADVPPASPFWLYVERVAAHGVISGYACGGTGEPCPGTYFRPGNLVTRGQTTKIIGNTFFPGCSTLK